MEGILPKDPFGKRIYVGRNLADIPEHSSLSFKTGVLTVKLDYYGTDDFFFSKSFDNYATSILTLMDMYGIYPRGVIVEVRFPPHQCQRFWTKRMQEKFTHAVSSILLSFPNLESLEITAVTPSMHWSQVKMMAAFLATGLPTPSLRIKENNSDGRIIALGSPLSRQLVSYARYLGYQARPAYKAG